ncbi:NlpC/P60 family protein [Streptomyces sp. NPDC046931]|uniref:C40 family peptidase n=1 Tax=Streptomyces sp. NPDC046931 TaxID=3154806 RepID=UPI0033F0ECAA
MAPERTPGPGGFGLPGMRRFTEDDGPSRAEVQQRIHNLYDRAETDSGTFNATRAAATGMARGANRVFGEERRRADPVLDDVAKQWFEAARLRLGPTVPAALPADRMPDGTGAAGSSASAKRPGSELVLRELGTADRPVRELTAGRAAGPVAELTAGPAAERTGAPVAELTAGPVAALPAVPENRPEAPRALPAPVAETGPSAPGTAKERNQRKLAAARDLLAQHTARHATRLPAIESRPAEDTWRTAEGQPGRVVEEAWQQLPATGPLLTPLPSLPTPEPLFTAEPLLTAPLPLPTAEPLLTTPLPLPTTELLFDTEAVFGTGSLLGTGGTQEPGHETKAAKAVAFARAQIGRPSLWGAAGPDSYDAAGLIQAAWKAAGVTLPRTARDQAGAGTAIPLTDIRAGDLVFFNQDAGHVGLCTGDGTMIHAPGPGAFIREESVFYAGDAAIHSATRPA